MSELEDERRGGPVQRLLSEWIGVNAGLVEVVRNWAEIASPLGRHQSAMAHSDKLSLVTSGSCPKLLAVEPPFDITAPVAKVPTDLAGGGSYSLVSPRIERGLWELEQLGHLVGRQEGVGLVVWCHIPKCCGNSLRWPEETA